MAFSLTICFNTTKWIMIYWSLIVFQFCLNYFLGDFFLSFDLHVSCHKHLPVFQFLIIIKLFCQNIAITVYFNLLYKDIIEIEKIKTFGFCLLCFILMKFTKKCDNTNFRWKLQINFMNIIWIIFQGNASVLDKREPYLFFS